MSSGRGFSRRRVVWAIPVLLLGMLGAAPVAAADSVQLEVTVVQVGDAPSGVAKDACAQKADGVIGKKVRYASLACLDTKKKKVGLNEVWKVSLPTGKNFVVRPIDIGGKGVLVAVDLEGSAQGDFRIQAHKPLVIGGPSHGDGELVIILESGD